jgi:hypothetical protein
LIKEHKLQLQKCYLAISDGMTLIIMAASVVKSNDLESQKILGSKQNQSERIKITRVGSFEIQFKQIFQV